MWILRHLSAHISYKFVPRQSLIIDQVAIYFYIRIWHSNPNCYEITTFKKKSKSFQNFFFYKESWFFLFEIYNFEYKL